MSKPICIHAWLARDNDDQLRTRLHLAKPGRHDDTWPGGAFYWVPQGEVSTVKGHHGLRPGQIKRVIIVEDEG